MSVKVDVKYKMNEGEDVQRKKLKMLFFKIPGKI